MVVTHANLVANEQMIADAYPVPSGQGMASWLPLFHDMGLIGGALQPVFCGYPCVLMSPLTFLKRPSRWLEAISRHRAAISPAPNFAYELCIAKVSDDELSALDLSRWLYALNGSEPVMAATLERFARRFAPAGFRREFFRPCYGLAEATLFVSGLQATGPTVLEVDARELGAGRVSSSVASAPSRGTTHALVAAGACHPSQAVRIVEPESSRLAGDGRVGEIWVSGPHVTAGYWRRPEETAAAFGARIEGSSEGPFLRTGDLGFRRGEDLFVTGRIKDVIIVRGRNHYPQDIEATVAGCHPGLSPGGVAAFGLTLDDEERVAVAAEVHGADAKEVLPEIAQAIRQAVAEEHDLSLHAVVLVKRHAIPKTTSGKLQRRACRDQFSRGELAVLHLDESRVAAPPLAPAPAQPPEAARAQDAEGPRFHTILRWLKREVAALAKRDEMELDPERPLSAFGLGSREAVELAGALEKWLGRPLSATITYAHPSLAALARHLAEGHEETALTVSSPTAPDGSRAIAIVGAACRAPGGVTDLNALWQLLRDGVDAIEEVPADRWDRDAWYGSEPGTPGRMTSRFGAFLRGIDGFDAPFFGVSAEEASHLDPQQRLLLEVAWEALENAGIPPRGPAGRPAGVFVGISTADYARLGASARDPAAIGAYTGTGNAFSTAAGRLSYTLDLSGPCLAVDTACSSGLAAVHLACQSLRLGECELAIAAGVNAILSPEGSIYLSQLGALAPDGRCKAFAASANGYVRGEGCGAVVLKRLEEALAGGDRILAVIRGTAIGHDGASNGLTAPSGPAQEKVIARALGDARLAPTDVGYVECHGTGTALGDPIEAGALGAVLGRGRTGEQPLFIGSIKSNLGHLEAAAGIFGLLKAALILQHREIPASLHVGEPSPRIPWEALRLRVARERTAWPAMAARRVAGVSSFGISGTNVHLLLEAAPEPRPLAPADEEPAHVLCLSAHSTAALRRSAGLHEAHLDAHREQALADVCSTAATGRTHLKHRLAVVAPDRESMRASLRRYVDGDAGPLDVSEGVARLRPRVAFLFSGQGAQHSGMGRALYESEPLFREVIDRCDACARQVRGESLREVMFSQERSGELEATLWPHAALYALQMGLVALWRSWGVEPEWVLGHSAGEIAAAATAGVFDLEGGLRLALERAALVDTLVPDGAMASVFASEQAIEAALTERGHGAVTIAAFTAPDQHVLTGERRAVETVAAALSARGVRTQLLRIPHAYHSAHLDPILDAFERSAAAIPMRAASIPIASSMTGQLASSAELASPAYWRQQTREPVRFAQALQALSRDGADAFVEIGPHPTLVGVGPTCLPDSDAAWIASLHARRDEVLELRRAVAGLFVAGVDLRWDRGERRAPRKVELPTYPFERARCWDETARWASPEAPHAGAPRDACESTEAPTRPANSELAARLMMLSGEPRREALAKHLTAELAKLLRLDREHIDADRGLFEFGLDSVAVLDLRRRLQRELGIEVKATLLFDYPSIRKLAGALDRALPGGDGPAPEPPRSGRAVCSHDANEPVAIVGIGCRFPGGADSPAALWRLLRDGVDCVSEMPRSRWPGPWLEGVDASCWRAGVLDDVESFDHAFFNISPREAQRLDPQQRLLLEVGFEALEDSGATLEALRGSRTAIFAGVTMNDWPLVLAEGTAPAEVDAYFSSSNLLNAVAGRLSFFLGLRGPSLAVDTACSSSLVAVHLACQSLRQRECDRALAAGVNLMLSPLTTLATQRTRVLSPDGRCKAFDASADGYVRSEGCAAITLRRLSDALADGNRIWGVIRGSAVNHGGATSGYSVPNGPAQQALIEEALERAHVTPSDIDYVECHGTGTALGDPIEAGALGAALGTRRGTDSPLPIGSVKTNLGHLEAAAGIAGVIKVALCLTHRELPPSLHLNTPSSHIDWEALRLRVVTKHQPWERSQGTRRAGVSSFGFSGTNAHLVLEEAPETMLSMPATAPSEATPQSHVLCVSARTPEALRARAGQYATHLAEHEEQALEDVCFTASACRTAFEQRAAVVGRDREELRRALETVAAGRVGPRVAAGRARGEPKVAFLFTGQGAQYSGMGRLLYEHEAVFRETLDACDAEARLARGRSLLEVMFDPARGAELDDTRWTQPALFALEMGLCRQWDAWGVRPRWVLGHSVGEVAAACAAGMFGLEDGMRLVLERGERIANLPREGAMASVRAARDVVERALTGVGSVEVAAYNGPRQVVISGERRAVEEVRRRLQEQGVEVEALPVSHAFHSALLEPALEAIERAAERVEMKPGRVPLVSNLSGDVGAWAQLTQAASWRRQVREPVQFEKGMQALIGQGAEVFLELGPRPTLLGLGAEVAPELDDGWIPSLKRGEDDGARMALAAAQLFARGAPVRWDLIGKARGARMVALPSYPFQRRRFPMPQPRQAVAAHSPVPEAPEPRRAASAPALLGRRWVEQGSAPSNALPPLEGPWVLVADQGGVAQALARRLQEAGQEVVLAADAEEALRAVERPGPSEHAALPAQGCARRLIFLAGLDLVPLELAREDLLSSLAPALPELVVLTKSLAQGARPTEVWVVTRGAEALDTVRPIAVTQALLAGFARVASNELVEHAVRLRWVDLDGEDDAEACARDLVRALAPTEDQEGQALESRIAYRGGRRLVERLAPLDPVSPPEALRFPGAHLVTGGLGALGFRVAEWLVERGAERVILLGRTPPTAARTATVETLRTRGARVDLVTGDVTDGAFMRELFHRLRHEGSAVDGVFHAAGIVDDLPLAQQAWPRIQAALAAKVQGAWALHTCTAAAGVRHFVLFSSASAVLGTPGQSSYAAANAFLDALAVERRRAGLPAVSIGWGPWAGEGMAGRTRAASQWAAAGMVPIAPEEGLAALERLLQSAEPSPTVLPVQSWARLEEALTFGGRLPLIEPCRTQDPPHQAQQATHDAEGAALRLRLAHASEHERVSLLLDYLGQRAASLLGDERLRVDVDRPLAEHGFDSLMAVQLRNAVGRHLEVRLPVTALFDHPTLRALAQHLAQLVGPGPEMSAPPPPAEPPSTVEAMSERELLAFLDDAARRSETP